MGEPILEPGKIPVALAGLVEPRVVNVPLAPHVKLEDTAGWSEAAHADASAQGGDQCRVARS